MAQIAYGQSNAAGLPPINLPSFGDNQSQGPLRITISKAAQPETDVQGLGPFAPWTPPAPGGGDQAPSSAAPQIGAPQAGQSDLGPFAPYSPQQPQDTPQIGGGEAALRGAARGLTFGFYPAIAGAASGVGSLLNGGDYSTAYNQTRQQEEQAQEEAQKQHPYITTAAEIAGNLPSMFIPGFGIGKAAQATATAVPRILQAIRSGAVAGGLYGAGDQTSKGASAWDIAGGAAGGAAAGGVLGGVLGSGIEGATHAGQRIASIVRGNRDADLEAQRLVLNSMRGDQNKIMQNVADKPALEAAQNAGTDIRLADYGGGNTHGLLRTATNVAPETRDIIGEDVIKPRFEQQGERIGRFIRSQFGGIESDVANDAIKDIARKQNAPAYTRAYAEGDKQIWTPELERLTAAPYIQAALRGAISKWKNYAVRDGFGAMNPPFRVENGGIVRVGGKGMPVYPNIQLWDYAARELQDRAREAPAGSQRSALFNDLARLLKSELDKEVPAYKAAREGAATFFKASDALQAGANFVHDTSISWRKAAQVIAKMSPAERELFRRGYAGELATKLERMSDNRNALNSTFLKNSDARKRTLVALGEEGASKLEALLRIESMIDRTRRALGNSTTIQQGHDAGKFAGVLAAWEGFKELGLNPLYLIAAPLIWGGRQTAKQIDERVFTKVAEFLMSDDPAVLGRGLDIAVKNPNVRTALRYASDLSARQLVALLGPSGVGAGALATYEHLKGSEHELPNQHPYDQQDYQGQQVAPH